MPEWVITARSPCTEIAAALSPTVISPVLVTIASSPNTSMPAPKPVTLIVPALLTLRAIALHAGCRRRESAGDGSAGEVADGVVVVDRNDGGREARAASPIVIAPAFVTVLLPATKIPDAIVADG